MTAPRAPIERTHVSDSTTLTIRTTMPASSEALGALTTTIADAGGTLVSSTVVAQRRGQEIRDTRVLTDSGDAVLAAVAYLPMLVLTTEASHRWVEKPLMRLKTRSATPARA